MEEFQKCLSPGSTVGVEEKIRPIKSKNRDGNYMNTRGMSGWQ